MKEREYCRQFIANTTLVLLLASSPLAQAGLVELSLFGETSTATAGNDFGLAVGDMVNLKAVFDESQLSGAGTEIVRFSDHSNSQISLFMGDLTFSKGHLLGFSLGYPQLHFFDGSFTGLDYLGFTELSNHPAIVFSAATTCCGNNNWFGLDSSQHHLSGTWDAESQKTSSIPDIPAPAPLVLAGVGLLGAWISSRRKKKVFNI